MKVVLVLAAFLFAIVFASNSDCSESDLRNAEFYSVVDGSMLWFYSEETGPAQLVGDTGIRHISGIAIDPTSGILYAIANPTAAMIGWESPRLYMLDRTSGAATFISTVGRADASGFGYTEEENYPSKKDDVADSIHNFCESFNDLAFDWEGKAYSVCTYQGFTRLVAFHVNNFQSFEVLCAFSWADRILGVSSRHGTLEAIVTNNACVAQDLEGLPVVNYDAQGQRMEPESLAGRGLVTLKCTWTPSGSSCYDTDGNVDWIALSSYGPASSKSAAVRGSSDGPVFWSFEDCQCSTDVSVDFDGLTAFTFVPECPGGEAWLRRRSWAREEFGSLTCAEGDDDDSDDNNEEEEQGFDSDLVRAWVHSSSEGDFLSCYRDVTDALAQLIDVPADRTNYRDRSVVAETAIQSSSLRDLKNRLMGDAARAAVQDEKESGSLRGVRGGRYQCHTGNFAVRAVVPESFCPGVELKLEVIWACRQRLSYVAMLEDFTWATDNSAPPGWQLEVRERDEDIAYFTGREHSGFRFELAGKDEGLNFGGRVARWIGLPGYRFETTLTSPVIPAFWTFNEVNGWCVAFSDFACVSYPVLSFNAEFYAERSTASVYLTSPEGTHVVAEFSGYAQSACYSVPLHHALANIFQGRVDQSWFTVSFSYAGDGGDREQTSFKVDNVMISGDNILDK